MKNNDDMTQQRNSGPLPQRRPSSASVAHPRSAVAMRRQGSRLAPVDAEQAPRTFGPAGVTQTPHAARGIAIYIGLDEEKAAQDGTNLTQIAQALQDYAKELASQAETSAVIALAPEGRGRDLEAVRAALSGSPAATGGTAGRHGPLRTRIPSRIQPPATREDLGLRVDIPRREIYVDGEPQKITAKEFDLLATLVSHPGESLSREELIEQVWAGQDTDERTVDVHIRRLRNRLGPYSGVVRTLRGVGYRFDEHPDVSVWLATAVK